MKPDAAESSEEEWEEVEETGEGANGDNAPLESVEVTLKASEVVKKKWKKKDWEREMIETGIRRALKKFHKDTQLDTHKVHLLSLLVLGMQLNGVCNDQELQATVLSLLPPRYLGEKENHVSAIFLTRFLQDFTKVFDFENGIKNLVNCGHVRQPKIRSLLLKVLEEKRIKFRIDIVLIVVVALRAMGLEARLVLSLQPIQLKVLTEKQKENAAKVSRTPGKVAKITKKRKDDDGIPQVDGQCDSPPKRATRSRSKRVADVENKPPLKADTAAVSSAPDASVKTKKNAKRKSGAKVLKAETKQVSDEDKANLKSKRAGKESEKTSLDFNANPDSKPPASTEKVEPSRKLRKRKLIKVEEDEKNSDEEFRPSPPSDSEDSDFESKSKSSAKNKKTKTATVANPASKQHAIKGAGKATKAASRRVSSQGKKQNDNPDDTWLEVYSQQEKRWLCVDIFRNAVNHPDQIEQYATKPLHYVLGFDNDGCIKDITARYSSKWLTDTRKLRVGNADKDWWRNTLAPYVTVNKDRDDKENIELRQKLLSQPMPTSVSAYKNHPLFALRRHLLKYEAIFPDDVPAMGLIRGEEVLPRSAIHTLHTRDKWMQEARVVRDGEEPYKMVASMWINMKLKQDMSTLSMPLFGLWQTEPYVPPVAENGKVPRNQYGNVDLFKKEMMPIGCVQINLPGIQKIARKLNIDVAAAITGFDSHSGYPHPVTEGFIVCKEHERILRDAWEEDQVHVVERERKKREERIFGRWKLLIKGALAKERIKRKYVKKDQGVDNATSSSTVNTGSAWQSKRLQQAREKSKPRRRGLRSKKEEQKLPVERETM